MQPIGVRDDFFAMGGDSLKAIKLFERIRQETGRKLALATMFGGATIEELGKVIEQKGSPVVVKQEGEETRTPVVVVRAQGSRRPFFFLHGQWEGGALYSLELAKALGPEQPFYLLEPYQFEGLAVPATLEEMAAAHIQAMRRIQPEGPYRLGGWCNGGLIAYEMARQFEAEGRTVELLVLMDSDAPGPRFVQDRRIIDALSNRLGRGKATQLDWFLLYRHLRMFFHYWRLRQSKRARKKVQAEGEAKEQYLQTFLPGRNVLRQNWISIYDWLAAGYMPHTYTGKITFFWTEEEPLRRRGWEKLIEGKDVDIHIIPGNHMTSRTQYLPILAEHLRSCMDSVG